MRRQSTKDRDHAIRTMTRLGITPHDQARLLRLGATLHRLAEAECSGDYPCDDGVRKVAECGISMDRKRFGERKGGCGSLYAPSALRSSRGYLCPACCAEEDAQKIAGTYGFRAVVNGDPRGMVLGLAPKAATREDIDSGRRAEYVR